MSAQSKDCESIMAKIYFTPAARWQMIILTCCVLSLFAEFASPKVVFDELGAAILNSNPAYEVPDGCHHLVSEYDEQDLDWQKQKSLDDDNLYTRLSLKSGTYWLNGSQERAVEENGMRASPQLVSRTVYRERYVVEMEIRYTSNEKQEVRTMDLDDDELVEIFDPVSWSVNCRGIYSKKHGQFCANCCAGKCDEDTSKQATLAKKRYFVPERSILPASVVDRNGHLEIYANSTSASQATSVSDNLIHVWVKYPESITIATPFSRGVMRSQRKLDDSLYFQPFIFSAVSQTQLELNSTVQDEIQSLVRANRINPDISTKKNLGVWSQRPLICPALDGATVPNFFQVLWDSTCGTNSGSRCSPFLHSPGSTRMELEHVHCRTPDWKITAFFSFKVYSKEGQSSRQLYSSEKNFLLVGEGYWNFYKGQLVMLAYYFRLDQASPVDTRIQITLQIPVSRTLHHRYAVVGHVRSMRAASDPLHFSSFSFGTRYVWLNEPRTDSARLKVWVDSETSGSITSSKLELKYIYENDVKAQIDAVCNISNNNTALKKPFPQYVKFPILDSSSSSILDSLVSVQITAADNSSASSSLYLSPFSIDQYFPSLYVHSDDSLHPARPRASRSNTFLVPTERPVSYDGNIFSSFGGLNDSSITAEGWYNSGSGQLCMLGCRSRRGLAADLFAYEEDSDESYTKQVECDIVFNLQYPPTNGKLWAKRPFISGSISSLLEPSHPLYFKPYVVNSTRAHHYRSQTLSKVLRRHLETIVSLGSSSLATLSIALQVGYSTRRSSFKSLRYMSLVMLLVLLSGQIFPILLNFAPAQGTRKFFSEERLLITYSGLSWWHVREAILQGTGLFALLLELRLVQLILRSRAADSPLESPNGNHTDTSLKANDVSVFSACLPIYAVVIGVVGYVHWQQPHSFYTSFGSEPDPYISNQVMADVQGFAGVTLDLFLLPQVIANVLWNTEAKVAPLHPVFYVGMTVVRSVAHLFDAWRARTFLPEAQHNMYYFANPDWDLYSSTWDILIPCTSLLLAAVLFLQQKFGGRRFLPIHPKWNKYETLTSVEDDLNL